MKKRMLIGFLIAIALSGCATKVDPGAETIRFVSNAELVRSCRFIQQSTFGAHSLPIDTTRENVMTQMRNAALAIGGTHVLTSGPQVTMPGPAATMTGDIYRCGQR